jgi:hypothetical protein
LTLLMDRLDMCTPLKHTGNLPHKWLRMVLCLFYCLPNIDFTQSQVYNYTNIKICILNIDFIRNR